MRHTANLPLKRKRFLNSIEIFQITNGDSDLSLSLAKQLSAAHKCRVILVKEPSTNNNHEIQRPESHQTSDISTFECNILASSQLDRLCQAIDKHFNGIDLLIDNGHATHHICRTPEQFITATSDNLRATINVSTNESRKFMFVIIFPFYSC